MKLSLITLIFFVMPDFQICGVPPGLSPETSPPGVISTSNSEMQTSLDLLNRCFYGKDSCERLLREVESALSLWPESNVVKSACAYLLAQAMATKPDCLAAANHRMRELPHTGLDPSFAIYEVEAHIHAERFDAASSVAKQLLTTMPGSARVLYDLGLANMGQGKFVEATSSFGQAAATGYPAGQWALGVCERVRALIAKPNMDVEGGVMLLEGLNVSSCWRLWDEHFERLI